MKKLLLIMLLIGSTALAVDSWRSNYEKGLQLIAQGKYEDAVGFLKMASADKPISEIISDKQGSFEYLPYLQMAICYSNTNRPQLAREYLQLEKSLLPVTESKGGKELLQRLEAKLDAHKDAPVTEAEDKVIRSFKKKPYLLSDSEVTEMKEEIRARCNLPKANEIDYPWYYHYELGMALKKKNDWQRALDSFILALDHRDEPQKFSRTYGMWYINYYPYYSIGEAHFRLKNWKCAESAFRLSQLYEDLPRSSLEFRELQEFKTEAEEHLNN